MLAPPEWMPSCRAERAFSLAMDIVGRPAIEPGAPPAEIIELGRV